MCIWPATSTRISLVLCVHSDNNAKLVADLETRNSRAMSTMVMSDRNRLSGVTPLKSPSISTLPHMFSPPPLAEEVCPVDDSSDDIYEMTQQHEAKNYEFVDPAKLRSQLIQDDDIYQVCLSVYLSAHVYIIVWYRNVYGVNYII